MLSKKGINMRLSKEEAQARLNELASWETGWDGWDETYPIPAKAIAAAQNILNLFPGEVSSISPDDGGVLLKFGRFPHTVQVATNGEGHYDYLLVEIVMDGGPDIPIEQVKEVIDYALRPEHHLREFTLGA
jgi:hypothetical protein